MLSGAAVIAEETRDGRPADVGVRAQLIGVKRTNGQSADPAKILVVEDEQIIALELKDRLTHMGHRVVGVAAAGQEAVEQARSQKPDLVLMDIKLQGPMDGIDAAKAILSEVDIPVVYLTAFADEPTVQRAKATAPYGYILKPFQERELQIVIEVSLHRHRLTRELRASQAFVSALLMSVADGVVAAGLDGRVKLVNPPAASLTGWNQTEAAGRPVNDVLNVVRLPEARSGIWKDTAYSKLVARDGSEHPIESGSRSIRDAAGGALGTVWVFRDISERKRWRDRQRFMATLSAAMSSSLESDEILAKVAPIIARSLGDWCVIHLLPRRASFETHGALRIGAFAHRESAKNALAKQLHGVAAPGSNSPIRNVMQSKRSVLESPVSDAAWIAKSLGIAADVAPGLGVASTIIVPLHGPASVFGTLTIVAESQARSLTAFDLAFVEEIGQFMGLSIGNAQSYADAQRAIQMREDVLAVVSHDLKNPLSNIGMIAQRQLLRPATIGPIQVMKNAQEIWKTANRMNRLIDDLRDTASIDAGRLSLDLKRHKARALIADCLLMFEGPASERSIRLIATPAPDVDLVCDSERILQVLSNLVGNALKFSAPRQAITIRVEAHGRMAQFSVSDEAGGIAPDQVEHIFRQYWQAPNACRRGSGLGLFIARGIVEAGGGRIWVDSIVGVGSTFRFTVPLA